jgi:UDP-N-acetylmuramoyl-tripeptide--D-alanyl-D-alanine ligase
VQIPALGVHVAHNALAALAVAWVLGADLEAAAAALGRYQPVGQRMLPSRVHSADCDWLLLEDCYNANPRSTETALDTLTTLPGPRAAVLGSMLELGPTERALHERVGAHAARCGIDLLVAVGPFATDYARGASLHGSSAQAKSIEVVCCDSHAEAAVALCQRLPRGTVLIKGSRGARMEHVVAALRDHARAPSPQGGC